MDLDSRPVSGYGTCLRGNDGAGCHLITVAGAALISRLTADSCTLCRHDGEGADLDEPVGRCKVADLDHRGRRIRLFQDLGTHLGH